MSTIDKATDEFIRQRAGYRCEYCLMPQSVRALRFQIDHIVAKQHGGGAEPKNLALCCGRCNRHKGPNLTSIDPQTAKTIRLFNPRSDVWSEHFRIERASVLGITAIGRATIVALAMNHPEEIAVREEMIEAGLWPPI